MLPQFILHIPHTRVGIYIQATTAAASATPIPAPNLSTNPEARCKRCHGDVVALCFCAMFFDAVEDVSKTFQDIEIGGMLSVTTFVVLGLQELY